MIIITDLPIETLEHIVAAIDSPTHLRNLAAVCTQLRSIVEPYHTQFRVIRAPLTSPIWKEIAENQLLAQNVRILQVQHEDANINDQVIPTIFANLEIPSVPVDISEDIEGHYDAKNAMDFDAERILVSALKGMSGLTSFQWSRTPSLINPNREDDIWITLANHCPFLNAVYVIDREKPWLHLGEESGDLPSQRPCCNPNFYLFKNLKSFIIEGSHNEVIDLISIEQFEQCAKMLIEGCPNLEVLNLSFANFMEGTLSASPLLSGPPWNSLQELTLIDFDFVSTELSSFLASNPTIEVLSLKCCKIDQYLVLPPHTLPRLKQLSTDLGSTIVNSILDSATTIPRPLNYVMGPSLNAFSLDRLERCGSGPNLDKLIMLYNGGHGGHGGGSNFRLRRLITRLSGIAPNLEWLDIRFCGQIDRTLCAAFGQFPHLRTLQGMEIVSLNCEDNTERIRALVALCPNLRRIDWYAYCVLDRKLTVVIERNGSHGTWSLRRIERETQIEGSVYTLLGERGQGSFEL